MAAVAVRGTPSPLNAEDIQIDKSGRVYFLNPDVAEAVDFASSPDDGEDEGVARAEAQAEARGNNCRCFNKGCRPQ